MTSQVSAINLAYLGGSPAITFPHPHADRAVFSSEDVRAIQDYLGDPRPTSSYYGREGLLRTYEDELAEYFSTDYCILTNSGTNALHSAFFGLGLAPGDEVISSTYTFHATIMPILQLGLVPVLADVDESTGNLCPNALRQALTRRSRAVVVTHQWGRIADMNGICEIAHEHGLRVVEDVSLSVGSTRLGKMAGTWGDVSCFSLGSTKLLSGGQGGGLVTNDVDIYERATLLGHFSRRSRESVRSQTYSRYADTGLGHNYRIHNLAVAVSLNRFRRINSLIAQRHARYELISEYLRDCKYFVPTRATNDDFLGSWHGYCVAFRQDLTDVPITQVLQALQAEGAEISPNGYVPLLHRLRTFQLAPEHVSPLPSHISYRTYSEGDFPVAERHVSTRLGLPLFLDEDISLVHQYGDAFRKVDRAIETILAAKS